MLWINPLWPVMAALAYGGFGWLLCRGSLVTASSVPPALVMLGVEYVRVHRKEVAVALVVVMAPVAVLAEEILLVGGTAFGSSTAACRSGRRECGERPQGTVVRERGAASAAASRVLEPEHSVGREELGAGADVRQVAGGARLVHGGRQMARGPLVNWLCGRLKGSRLGNGGAGCQLRQCASSREASLWWRVPWAARWCGRGAGGGGNECDRCGRYAAGACA